MSVLVLNASYEPMKMISWQKAVTLLWGNKCELVERDESGSVISSAGGEQFPLPAVIRYLKMAKASRGNKAAFSRNAVAARDRSRCQVSGCGHKGTTIDHVIPRSKGGEHSWTNVVMMCQDHNTSKSDRTLDDLGWTLKREPKAPTAEVILLSKVDESLYVYFEGFVKATI